MYLDDINIGPQVGIEEAELISGLSIFPNPGNEQININFGINQQKKLTIKIYNVLGELIESKTDSYQAGDQTINISTKNYPNGYYTITVNCDEQYTTQPLIINH
ncbi:MAG: T9SS type A sorting domain-containing protein [Bacteroidetes bacterium]|nr:T9SS type A sorting domain-containing protein [Bacteroidota bacterium]